MAQRTSVALFLATSALIGSTAAPAAHAATGEQFPAPGNPQQLAQAAECVPSGEGENCARDRVRKKKAPATATPASDASGSSAAPAVDTATPKVQD